MTGTAASVAARGATARVVGGDSAARQQLRAAKSLVKLFSGMRGAAMKVGQTLSAVDLGLVPESVRPEFQEILASLQQNAEPVSFKAIRRVVEEDLEGKLSTHFADFDEEPIAAASIGQVHRATLHDGRDVAVKVQYPGIAEAIHSDLQNLRLGLRLLSAIAPGIDTGEIATEIRERISEELDYELEAAHHRAMARIYRDHPFIHVPDVMTDLCRERVLVTAFVDGERLPAMKARSQTERDRAGEILVRFYINGPLRHRLLNGDPHPGNSLFLADGRVAFLDFGFCKRLTDADVDQIVRSTRAAYEDDGEALLAVVSELGSLPANPQLAQPFLESYQAIFGWLMVHEPLTADPARTASMMGHYNRMRKLDGFEQLALPAEHFVLMRSIFLLIGLLGQLGSTNAWFDIAGEWLYGNPPATQLGHQEEAFMAALT